MPVDRLYRFDPPIGYVTLLEVVSMLKELYPLVREDQLQQIPTSRLTRYFVPEDGVLATSVVPLLTTLPASLLSVLSPTTLLVTQNNYNPAGLDAHDRFRLSASVASPDFTSQPPGTTSFEDAQNNTWTLNGNAQIV